MKKFIIVLCIATALIVLAGAAGFIFCLYTSAPLDPLFEEAKVVLCYIANAPPGQPFSFDLGPYKGGTAVLGANGMAFWVKGGTGYAVNESAKKAAPELAQAPDDIQLDDAFIEAVHTDE